MRSITTIDTLGGVTNSLDTCGHPSRKEANGSPTVITPDDFTSPVRQLKKLEKGLPHDLLNGPINSMFVLPNDQVKATAAYTNYQHIYCSSVSG